MHHVHFDIDAGTAWLDTPEVSVDLGAIGKGYAVDLLTRRLRERGIEAGAVISGRSSILVWGTPPGEDSWRFEVVHPDDPEETLATLRVMEGAISSSGASERSFFRGGREYGHILDPPTGRPASRVRGVTVWSETAILGDVLSTALFVLGEEALGEDGCVRRLVEAWKTPGSAGRAGVLLVTPDQGVWGGIRCRTFHAGKPGFTLYAPDNPDGLQDSKET
jgi:thiamine biosynthesis lipoprotein ApbE